LLKLKILHNIGYKIKDLYDPKNDPEILDLLIAFEDVIGNMKKEEFDEFKRKMEIQNGRFKA